jgi:hypothetical protein
MYTVARESSGSRRRARSNTSSAVRCPAAPSPKTAQIARRCGVTPRLRARRRSAVRLPRPAAALFISEDTVIFISEDTVNFHLKNILAKLHLKNRAQAVAWAIRSGLAGPPAPER